MENIDTSWVNLQIDTLLQKFVGEYFQSGESIREFRREELYSLLRVTVRDSLTLYQQNFALGIRKSLAEARLKIAVEERGEG